MANKKQTLKEDLTQIDYLMGYDRSKTIFEQKNKKSKILKETKRLTKKRPLNEVAWVPAIAVALGAAEVVDWVSDWWNDEGDMGGGEKYALAMDRNTWPEFEKALRKLEIETGVPVLDDLDIISEGEAEELADGLYDAMYGAGTSDNYMRSFINKLRCIIDLARVTKEFGKRKGANPLSSKTYDLEEYIDGDLSDSDINRYIKAPLATKPFMIYKDKQYSTGAEFLTAVQEDIEGEAEPEEVSAFSESFDCVIKTSKKHGGKLKKSKSGLEYYQIRIGNDVGLFTVDGRVVFYPGGKKANRKPKEGFASYVCQGDELSLGDEGDELSLDEGLKRALKKKYNLSEEEFRFGDMFFDIGGPAEEPEKEEEGGGGSGKRPHADKPSFTKGPTFEQVVSGSRILHRGHSGPGVKKLQELLPGANLKLDGLFGKNTEAAVIAFQKANETGSEAGGEVMAITAKALLQGGSGGSQEVASGPIEGCTPAQKKLGMMPIPGGGCACPNGQKADANGKCVPDNEYPEDESVAVVVNQSDNKGDLLKAGDQLVFDSEGGVDVLVSPSGTRFETTDDVEVTKYNKSGEFKKIVTATQKCTFYKDGKIKKCRDRKKGLFGLGGSKNK